MAVTSDGDVAVALERALEDAEHVDRPLNGSANVLNTSATAGLAGSHKLDRLSSPAVALGAGDVGRATAPAAAGPERVDAGEVRRRPGGDREDPGLL